MIFKKKGFTPDWNELSAKPGTMRSIVKYGDQDRFKHPSDGWFQMMKDDLLMTDADFMHKQEEGNFEVKLDEAHAIKLDAKHIEAMKKIVGEENVATDDYSRVKYASGKTTDEIMELRKNIIREVGDVVVHPRHKEDVKEIVVYCNKHKIPITVYAAGSSVNRGCRPVKGGVSLVLSTHMNKIVSINDNNQTTVVQAGMYGPAFEEALNNAPERFNSKRRYTCGHFPQSFEYSTVGGWAITLGSGQDSSYYGDAYDLILSGEYVTPSGNFKTQDFPGTATGPRVNDMMVGSEGTYGILVEVTWKLHRYMPENRRFFACMYPSWDAAVDASREIMQGEFGVPAVYRISDPEETDRGLKLYGMPDFVDKLLQKKGYKPMQRCLCLGMCQGDADYTRLVKRKVRKTFKQYGAMYLTSYPGFKWEKTRFTEPFMREDLQDYGIQIDTLEAGVTWDNLHNLHNGVREYMKTRPNTMCMTHASHFYPQGTNLYFIFITRTDDLEDFQTFQTGIIENIRKHGGSLSHHHGVGRMIAPYMEKFLGAEQMAVLRALKNHFDPNNIMNPGGQLGLDLPEKDRR